MAHRFTAYFFARLALGTSLLGHGLIRLPKLDGFSSWMTGMFAESPLPVPLVDTFAYVLPFIELLLGLLVFAGLLTRKALGAGAMLMIILIFGSCMIEKWDMVATQLFYALYFSTLMAFAEYNRYSLDYRLGLG